MVYLKWNWRRKNSSLISHKFKFFMNFFFWYWSNENTVEFRIGWIAFLKLALLLLYVKIYVNCFIPFFEIPRWCTMKTDWDRSRPTKTHTLRRLYYNHCKGQEKKNTFISFVSTVVKGILLRWKSVDTQLLYNLKGKRTSIRRVNKKKKAKHSYNWKSCNLFFVDTYEYHQFSSENRQKKKTKKK